MELKDLLKPNFEVYLVCNEKESYVKAKGNTASLLTALTSFVEALKENNIDEKAINYAVKQGLLIDEELEKETKKNIDELLKKIFE